MMLRVSRFINIQIIIYKGFFGDSKAIQPNLAQKKPLCSMVWLSINQNSKHRLGNMLVLSCSFHIPKSLLETGVWEDQDACMYVYFEKHRVAVTNWYFINI